jgi:hypothetical protein
MMQGFLGWRFFVFRIEYGVKKIWEIIRFFIFMVLGMIEIHFRIRVVDVMHRSVNYGIETQHPFVNPKIQGGKEKGRENIFGQHQKTSHHRDFRNYIYEIRPPRIVMMMMTMKNRIHIIVSIFGM